MRDMMCTSLRGIIPLGLLLPMDMQRTLLSYVASLRPIDVVTIRQLMIASQKAVRLPFAREKLTAQT